MPTPEQIDTIRRLNDAARTHPGLASQTPLQHRRGIDAHLVFKGLVLQ